MLNFDLPDLQVLVGSDDITPYVVGLSFQHPIVSTYEPYVWSGSIELGYLLNPPLSADFFNDEINPQRWLSCPEITIKFGGTIWQKFRIAPAPAGYQYDEVTGDAIITITDNLGLLRTVKSVPQNHPGIALGVGTPWFLAAQQLINKAVEIAGVSITVDACPYNGNLNLLIAPRTITESWVDEACKLAGERGVYPWCDQGVIKWQAYPINGATPIYSKPRNRLRDFNRIQGLEPPVQQLTIAATVETASPDPTVYPVCSVSTDYDVVDGVAIVKKRTTICTYRPLKPGEAGSDPPYFTITQPLISISGPGSNLWQYTITTIEEPANVVMPDIFPNSTALITSSIATAKQYFDPKEGKATVGGTLLLKPIGAIVPYLAGAGTTTLYPDPTAIFPAQTSNVTYNYSTDGLLASIITLTQARPDGLFAQFTPNLYAAFELSGSISERWDRATVLVPPDQCTYRYEEKRCAGLINPDAYNPVNDAGNITSKGLILILYAIKDPKSNVAPPEPPVLDSLVKVTQTQISTVFYSNFPSFSPFIQRADVIQVQTLQNVSGLQFFAKLINQWRFSQFYSRRVTHPYDSIAYVPFQIVNLVDGQYVRDNWGIHISKVGQDQLEFVEEYSGYKIGSIPQIPYDVLPAPPQIGVALAICTVPNQAFTQGVPIVPIPLTAAGGTPPYTFSGSLPTGLSVSGSAIVGTPSALGTTSSSATVTDAVSATATSPFSIVVSAAPVPVAVMAVTVVDNFYQLYEGDWILIPTGAGGVSDIFKQVYSGDWTLI
jgi:hypothetical protein